MAQQFTELCTFLVQDAYGDLHAQIYTTIAKHGRLTLNDLLRISGVPPRQTRHAISSLLQQHLLYHFTPDESPTYFQANWRNAYNLVRSGRVVGLIGERMGEGAAHIIANLLQLGHARVGDLADAYDVECAPTRDSGIDTGVVHTNGGGMVNGNGHDHATPFAQDKKAVNIGQFHATARKMLNAGFLAKVGRRAYRSDNDRQDEIEEIVFNEHFPDRKVTGPKKKREFEQATNHLKRKLREEDEYHDNRDLGSKGTIRQSTNNASSGPSKRIKVNGDLPNGLGRPNDLIDVVERESGPKLSNDLVIRVNYAKCTVALRSMRLEKLASRFLGDACGTIYAALLRSLEGKVRAVRDDLKQFEDSEDEEAAQPSSSVLEVGEHLPLSVDLTCTIKGTTDQPLDPTGARNSKRRPHVIEDSDDFTDIGIKREHHSDDEDGGPVQPPNGFHSYRDKTRRTTLIEQHLLLLEEHPLHFCSRVTSLGRSEWRINFPALATSLINGELDTTIQARFGRTGLRVARLLRDKGKLDEKQVASSAMMRIKDVRAVLTELQSNGFLECQELPKDGQRQPSRTFYLWYFDPKRARTKVLHETYQAMARCIQRVKVERESGFKDVLEKAERLDVKDREETVLTLAERQLLKQWRETEERLLAQIERCDNVVGVLRDFGGFDTSMST